MYFPKQKAAEEDRDRKSAGEDFLFGSDKTRRDVGRGGLDAERGRP